MAGKIQNIICIRFQLKPSLLNCAVKLRKLVIHRAPSWEWPIPVFKLESHEEGKVAKFLMFSGQKNLKSPFKKKSIRSI